MAHTSYGLISFLIHVYRRIEGAVKSEERPVSEHISVEVSSYLNVGIVEISVPIGIMVMLAKTKSKSIGSGLIYAGLEPSR